MNASAMIEPQTAQAIHDRANAGLAKAADALARHRPLLNADVQALQNDRLAALRSTQRGVVAGTAFVAILAFAALIYVATVDEMVMVIAALLVMLVAVGCCWYLLTRDPAQPDAVLEDDELPVAQEDLVDLINAAAGDDVAGPVLAEWLQNSANAPVRGRDFIAVQNYLDAKAASLPALAAAAAASRLASADQNAAQATQ